MARMHAPDATNDPKRAKRIRLYVWLVLILFIGELALEATSRSSYEKTYESLQTSIYAKNENGQSEGIPLKDVDQHIKGYPFRSDKMIEYRTNPVRGEQVVKQKRRIVYKWPSLLKRYEFRLTLGKNDQVISIEAVAPGLSE